MNSARIAGVVTFVVLTSAVGTGQPQKSQAAGADAIKAVADTYVKASLARDVKAIAALYTDDAIEMPPNQPMVKGRAAIEQFYQREFASGATISAFSLSHIQAEASGDLGYDVGTYQQTATPPGAANPVSDTGKYTVILRRTGGAWKVAYAIYNSDQPPQR